MKTSLARFGVAFAMAFSMVCAAVAKDGATSATITKISGTARYSTDGQNWQTLAKGMTVQPGTIIQTAAASSVDVLLGEQAASSATQPAFTSLVYFTDMTGGAQANVVRVLESTTLAIDKLTSSATGADMVSETQLDLRQGSVAFSVKKLSAASKFEIKFPKGVAGVRGTGGWMNHLGQVRLLTGTVVESFFAADGVTVKTQVIEGRHMFDPSTALYTPLSDDILHWLSSLLGSFIGGGGPMVPVTLMQDTTILHNSANLPNKFREVNPDSRPTGL